MRSTITRQATCTANLPGGPFVVYAPSCIVQQAGDHAIPIAPILIGQLDDVVRQAAFIGSTLGRFAPRRSVQTASAAGPALRHAKLLPHAVDALATTRRA